MKLEPSSFFEQFSFHSSLLLLISMLSVHTCSYSLSLSHTHYINLYSGLHFKNACTKTSLRFSCLITLDKKPYGARRVSIFAIATLQTYGESGSMLPPQERCHKSK